MKLSKLKTIAIGAIFVAFSAQVNAAMINFSSTILDIELDDGTSGYSGTVVGDTFSGSFTYGNSASEAAFSLISADVAEHFFIGAPFSSSITDGSVLTSGDFSTVENDNNAPIDSEEAGLLNNLFGSSVSGGDQFDSWAAFGGTDQIEFGIILWFDTSTYDNLDFKVHPPAISNIQHSLFFLVETNAAGDDKFISFGSVDSLFVVPAPGVIWLFLLGLVGIIGVRNVHSVRRFRQTN